MLYTAWAALIFFLHPVGLSGMGSSLGGARFYFKIALALVAFLILANQKITERDAKWLIRLLIIGSIVSLALELFALTGSLARSPRPLRTQVPKPIYTWHQALSGPAYWIMLYLVSRYKIREVIGFTRPWVMVVALFCIALAAVSGKRAGFASVMLLPLVAAFIRKEYSYVIIGGILAADFHHLPYPWPRRMVQVTVTGTASALLFSWQMGLGSKVRVSRWASTHFAPACGNWPGIVSRKARSSERATVSLTAK